MSSKKTAEAKKLRIEIGSLFQQLEQQRQLARSLNTDPKIRTVDDDVKVLQQTNASSNMKLLLMNIDKWIALQEPGTEDFQTGLIMKICAKRFQTSFAIGNEEFKKVLREVLNKIEPFAETPKGIFLYINMATLLYEHDPLIKKAYDVFKRYTNTEGLIWNYTNTFSGEAPTQAESNDSKDFLYNHLCYVLFSYFAERLNLAEAVKFAVPGIRYLQNSSYASWKYSKLEAMVELTKSFLVTSHFKQLDHCLAGLMFHLVKYRQSLQESKRKEVSKLQAEVAKMFTMWGASIVNFSLLMQSKGIPVRDFPIDNDSYEELKWFQEPGVEVYAHQFPVNLVDSTDELKRIAKRVNKWDKKTGELFKDGGSNEWIPGAHEALVMMNNHLQTL